MISPLSPVATHQVFEGLAFLLAGRYYFFLRRRSGLPGILEGRNFPVAVGCIAGAAVGNKLVFWLQRPDLWAALSAHPFVLVGASGQSIVGGLVGGLLGTEGAKSLTRVRTSTGDAYVFPLLLGLFVGRIGCFLAGLADDTYGLPTTLPWGVDFGDGVRRHPTQLYEMAYLAAMWLALRRVAPRLQPPGMLFRIFLVSYLLWRLLIDMLKPAPLFWPLGLSGIQWTCVLTLAIYVPLSLRLVRGSTVVQQAA